MTNEDINGTESKGKVIKFDESKDMPDTTYPEFDDDFMDMDDDDDNSEDGCWACFLWGNKSAIEEQASLKASVKNILSSAKSFQGKKREKQLNVHCEMRAKRANERAKILTAPVDLGEDFVPPLFPKSESEKIFIRKALIDNFIFSSLSKNNIDTLILAMEKIDCASDTIIIEQGEVISDYFYIVAEGVVDFVVDGKNVGQCSRGSGFGELALLYNCPRAATCISETDCTLYKLDHHTFHHVVAATTTKENQDLHDKLKEKSFFSQFDEMALTRLIDLFTTLTFAKDEVLFRKGDPGDVLYIVNKGSVLLSDLGSGKSRYSDIVEKSGDCFGELAILTNEGTRNGTATAIDPNTEVFCLSRFDFGQVFGDAQDTLIFCQKRNVLKSVSIFVSAGLQHHELMQLMNLFKRESFPKKHVLVKSGQPCLQSIRFIHSGKVVVNKDHGVMKSINSGDYFGSTFIQESPDTPSTNTVVMEEDTVLFTLSKSDIISVIGSDRMKKGSTSEHRKKKSKPIELRTLKKVKILGAGSFGTVWLVQHKETREPYALKLCGKKEILEFEQVQGIIREKHILTTIDHPFILNLVTTYQDRYNLLFLFDIVQGGELYKLIISQDRLPNSHAVFYASCLLEAFSYLHDRHICYRDLKPENVLIDAQGYCKLVDMGFAKFVLDKTFTFCGTPEYIAPEIILSKGHNQDADCWSFGVLIYEMLVGFSPFYNERSMDQTSLFKRIVRLKYKCPGNVNDSAKDLIEHLLIFNPHNRYSFSHDDQIRSHDWFVGENKNYFNDLMEHKISAPWAPEISNATDSSNFDDFSDLEKMRQKYAMLSNDDQMKFKDF